MCIHCDRRRAKAAGTTVDEIAYLEKTVATLREDIKDSMPVRSFVGRRVFDRDTARLSKLEKALAEVHASHPDEAVLKAFEANTPEPFDMEVAVSKAADGMADAIDREILSMLKISDAGGGFVKIEASEDLVVAPEAKIIGDKVAKQLKELFEKPLKTFVMNPDYEGYIGQSGDLK